MRPLRVALLLLGIAFGLLVEWVFYDARLGPALTAADLAVGCVLIVCGVIAWERRTASRAGPLMMLAGFTWFLGNVASVLLYLHRGPLVHLHLSYPTGRIPTRLAGAVVVAAYVDATIEPLARNDLLTLVLSGLVALTALQVFLGTTGPARKAGGPALAAALAFAAVLALGAVERLAGLDAGRTVLWIYDTVIVVIALVLLSDLLRGRWVEAVVTGLVVDLGPPEEVGTLQSKLARALGDPSLVVGYRLQDADSFVDDAGRQVVLPPSGSGRAVTTIDDRGEQIAVLVHDAGLMSDERLVESVAAAARIAIANARLQAEARSRADELEASRRRIVESADAQRRQLEERLRLGPEERLVRVSALLSEARAAATTTDGEATTIGALENELERARLELREFAQGMHPAALTDVGLNSALALIAERLAIPVDVNADVDTLPEPLEAAILFVCSEALTNVAKHAAASRASIELTEESGRVITTIEDDGVGSANADHGSGLRGLADRVEALGGQLAVESPPGLGTRIVAVLPRTT